MAANTTDGITYPTGTDGYAYATQMAALANTTQAALDKRLRKPADLAALNAVTGMSSGDIAVVQEGGALYEYNGTLWAQATPSRFTTTTARDTAYAKASGAYRVIDALAIVAGVTYRYTGATWHGWWSDWITYTPTFSNLTPGNGTLSAAYRFKAGIVMAEGALTFGSTSSLTGAPRITHPVTTSLRSAMSDFLLGTTSYVDSGTAAYTGVVVGVSTTQADLRTNAISGSFLVHGGLSNTTPVPWTTGDIMTWRYEIGQA